MSEGRIVLDERDALVDRRGEDWLDQAAKQLTAQGHGGRVLLEATPKPARGIDQVLGYFSWGSTDPQNRVRRVGMGFVPGAIAAGFVGTDARTFQRPPDTWVPTANLTNRAGWFASSPESLIADLIEEGVTGVAGHVAEPLFQGAIRPQILFPAYLAGFNLIEAFYLSIPNLGWQTIVIGDPLCAPFPRKGLSPADLEDEVDTVTELPSLFSRRLVAAAAQALPGISERAVALSVRADVLLRRGDNRNGRAALIEAVNLSPSFWAALFRLAALDQSEGEYDAAIERYRQVLAIQPNQAVVLNNLAYVLAVHRQRPAEAAPLARRALKIAPNDPNILDTLAWTEYLLGENQNAATLIRQAVRGSIQNAEVRLHAAVIIAATGSRTEAETHLAAALKLDPSLEKSEEVRKLREQWGRQ